MSSRVNLNYKNFRIAVAASIFVSALISGLSFILGKNEAFFLLNNDFGSAADLFFQYFTHLGDGMWWFGWLAVILVKKRYRLLPLIVSAFTLTTSLTDVFKHVILPHELRPSRALDGMSALHFVDGVTLYSFNSFPSGHTATAFTFVLMIALIVNRRDILLLSFIVALLVGYSRVYLGQHFPLDVGAGIAVAVCSVSLSVIVHRRFEDRSLDTDKSKQQV